MEPSELYNEPHEIGGRLIEFGCGVQDLQDVALMAVSARNEATPLHPANAPGTFSYMAGVAGLRMTFLPKEGWEKRQIKGVEAVENKALGLVILFQNVDFACGIQDPNPISSKGEAVTSLVDNPTDYLWSYMAEEDKTQENWHVWFFCVSCNGDEVRAELSRPRAITKGGFGTFAERIFIIQSDDWSPLPEETFDNFHAEDDFDVPVSKKK